MREKQQKRAALRNASSRKMEKPATSDSEPVDAVRKGSDNVQSPSKSKEAPPRKYKFTPIVFDLDSKASGELNPDVKAKQSQLKSLEIRADADNSSVLGRRRVSISKTVAKAATDSAAAVTDIPVGAQSSVPTKSDLTTMPSPAAMESLADGSERKISPVTKRQSSSTPLSDGSKKRRTSVDSR